MAVSPKILFSPTEPNYRGQTSNVSGAVRKIMMHRFAPSAELACSILSIKQQEAEAEAEVGRKNEWYPRSGYVPSICLLCTTQHIISISIANIKAKLLTPETTLFRHLITALLNSASSASSYYSLVAHQRQQLLAYHHPLLLLSLPVLCRLIWLLAFEKTPGIVLFNVYFAK